jgi:hypothetical protein
VKARVVAVAGLVLACAGGPAPALDALPSGSPRAMLDACAAEPFPELAWGCRLEAAAAAGREGDAAIITEACDSIPHPVWVDECRFRAGEEAGRHGHTELALATCGSSTKYGRFCLTHAGWGMPPDTTRDAAQWVAYAEDVLPEPLRVEAADVLRARWWFNRYVGTGNADPLDAQGAAPAEAAHARGAWAIEVLRLTGGDFGLARAVWEGRLSAPPGAPLPLPQRVGHYDVGLPIPGETELPHVRTFGDARRLVGQSVDEDVTIALLEARYFLGEGRGDVFRPFLDDPRPRVRYTAFHLFRILPSEGVEATLSAYTDDPDPVVRAHVTDALKYRTWEGRPNAVGPRRPDAPGAG